MRFYLVQQDIINPVSSEILICKGSQLSEEMVTFLYNVFGFDDLAVALIA